jgi:rhodanese-related sulfurtransferase
MAGQVDARSVKAWLLDTEELAFLDVREHGQYGEGHPFQAVPVPYSRFEPELVRLVPNANVRMVLLDDGDGVAERAARAAEAIGYRRVNVLTGGAPAWRAAGFTLYAGVNVPSKTFGELLEHRRHTPRISAEELYKAQRAGENLVVVDGRPFTEYKRMNIPGGVCCPNGELALRIQELAPDPVTRIVVNCAGRTRSIIGAETLIALGVANPVVALENGTQGWFLAGLELERGAERRYTDTRPQASLLAERMAHARAMAASSGVLFVSADTVAAWVRDEARTTYLLDVRTPEEFAAGSAPGFQHAPGGQLVQSTDQWVGVLRARVVLADDDGIRAPMMARWLAQLGHDVAVLEGGIAAGASLPRSNSAPSWKAATLQTIDAAKLVEAIAGSSIAVVDVRAAFDYRKGHISNAIWGIRPRLDRLKGSVSGRHVVLVADRADTAALVAGELGAAGGREVGMLAGGFAAWAAAGRPVVSTPDQPADADCIDYLFFVHDRHEGNAEAARGYLAWEQGLLAQLDDQERGVFRIS